MRASELIGAQVRCRDGVAGSVIDLRIDTGVSEGSPVHELGLAGLVVSPRRLGSTVGYDRQDDQRPKLLAWLVRRLHRHDRYIDWELVREHSGGVVRVEAAVADLPAVPLLPPRPQ
ncbi:MAG: hypothetical protein M3042_10670 [Actinomycetota bacterium]|nr:hypothetical protein [Actinomycetota bacterium]